MPLPVASVPSWVTSDSLLSPPYSKTSTLRSRLDMSVLLPLSPALQETPSSPFGKSSTPSSRQHCQPSNKKVARHMKLKVQMRKMLKKNGRTLVREMMEEVAQEERVMHDVFGCADCFVDLTADMFLIVR